MLQQGTMQNVGILLHNFEKHTNNMLTYLLNFLLDFSNFIDFSSSKETSRSHVVDSFIESNMVTRIFILAKNLTVKLQAAVERHQSGSSLVDFNSVMGVKQYREYLSLLNICLDILFNICQTNSKKETSLPRIEVFKCDIFEVVTDLIEAVVYVLDANKGDSEWFDPEVFTSISGFLANSSKHLLQDSSKITIFGGNDKFIDRLVNVLLNFDTLVMDFTRMNIEALSPELKERVAEVQNDAIVALTNIANSSFNGSNEGLELLQAYHDWQQNHIREHGQLAPRSPANIFKKLEQIIFTGYQIPEKHS